MDTIAILITLVARNLLNLKEVISGNKGLRCDPGNNVLGPLEKRSALSFLDQTVCSSFKLPLTLKRQGRLETEQIVANCFIYATHGSFPGPLFTKR